MTEKNLDKKTSISAGSIIIGALVGTSFLIILGALLGALKSSIRESVHSPSNGVLLIIGVLAVICLCFAFFLAGFISAKMAHQYLKFDAIVHALSSFALMSIFVIFSVLVVTAVTNLRHLPTPVIVTDIRFKDPNAITKITTEESDKTANKEDKELAKLVLFAWWVSFCSLVLGAGTSALGGHWAHRQIKSKH